MPNPKWRSIISDHQLDDRKQFSKLVKEFCPQVTVMAKVADAADTIACINKLDPNLIFLNVTLSDGNAFDMLDQLSGINGQLVFMAKDEANAVRAFRYHAFDYLVKPVLANTLLDLMARLDNQAITARQGEHFEEQEKFNFIFLNEVGIRHMIKIQDVCHLEGDGNYSTVFLMTGEKIIVSKPLKHFEDILPAKSFFRVHQSHLINIQAVYSVTNSDAQLIHLKDGSIVPLSRRKKDQFLSWLIRP